MEGLDLFSKEAARGRRSKQRSVRRQGNAVVDVGAAGLKDYTKCTTKVFHGGDIG
jgi:hypothetical protein